MATKDGFDLSGKDYFTEQEAAHYCCVCFKQFRNKAKEHGLFPFRFMGKLVYRRTELQAAIEKEAQWQRSESAAIHGNLPGTTHKGSIESRLVVSLKGRRASTLSASNTS